MASQYIRQQIPVDKYDYPVSRNIIINEMKNRILKSYPNAEFDQEPYFKVQDIEMGVLYVPYFLKENHNYEQQDHIIIDKNFLYAKTLGQKLQNVLSGSKLIDFDPTSIGYSSNENDDFAILIQFDLCRNHLLEVIKSILEINLLDDQLIITIRFTKSDNLKHNKLGGKTLFYLTNDELLSKTTAHLSSYELISNVEFLDIEDPDEERDFSLVTDDKIREVIYDINTELSKENRGKDFWI